MRDLDIYFLRPAKGLSYYEILDDTLRDTSSTDILQLSTTTAMHELSNRSSSSIRMFLKGLALNELIGFRLSDDSTRASLNCAL